MRLKTAEIDRYGPLYDCRPPCQDGISVLSGPNEAGKTLYLEALLQLLEPDVANLMNPSPRVDQSPTGRVIVEHGGDQYECDGTTSLCEITPIEPSHLQSVFVVQDSDLQLPSDQEYYTSLIEKLGDIHTREINEIKSVLKDRGRLTRKNLNISSKQSYNKAGSVRDDADALANEIREYVDEVEEEGLDELNVRRLRVKRQLKDARKELDTQQEASAVAEYERLSEQLDTYRSTTEELADLNEYDRETFDQLRELQNDLKRDRQDLQDLDGDIDEKENEVETTAETLEELKDRQSRLNRRESAVEDARSELEAYREQQDAAAGANRLVSLTKPASLVALLGAGGTGLAGAITGSLPAISLGFILLLIAVVSGVLYYQANQRLTAVETTRETVLQTARDAGFKVESVEEVAPAIETFDGQLADVNTEVAKTEQQHGNAQEELEELREEKSKLESQIADQKQELEEQLEAANVESLEKYENQVEAREELKPERQTAKQSLIDRFGDPTPDDPKQKAAHWERDLNGLIEDININDVDADTYAEEEQQRLEQEVERLTNELDDLQERLNDHDDQLERFDKRARSLNTQPFVDRSLELEAHSKDGLEALATELDSVVAQIEEDAELSRKALEIFSQIESREEQKLTDLFDPDGPASRTFEQLTGGRYTEVAYDPDTHELAVERQDGRTFNPEILSQGTKDQLYFATRVSLAKQLLGNTPGFLLLDDPFLAADPERLQQGFQTLQELANDGWQILYLTAKHEVSETMVNEFNLNHVEMSPATPST